MGGNGWNLNWVRSRRLRVSLAALAALAIGAVVFVAASGAGLSDSTFEGNDGDMIVNHGGSDWSSWAGNPSLRTLLDLTNSTSDNAFTQGSHEDDPNVTIDAGSIPNSKADLSRAYVASETVAGQPFLYLAWERASLSGTVNFDFELNQKATAGWTSSTTGPVTIDRTEGDVLITYDFNGNPTGAAELTLLYWLTAGNGHTSSDCAKSGEKLPCWGNRVLLTPTSNPPAVGAVNLSTIGEPIIGGGATLTEQLFGEAKINLGDPSLNVFQPNTCKAFGSVYVNSRSSVSFDSEMKDFIAPSPIHVSNCGSIELKKHWVGSAGNATLNVGSSAGGSQVSQGTANGADGTTGGTDVESGTYYLSESLANASDYSSSLSCTDNGSNVPIGTSDSVPVASGHAVVCTFTNTRNQGSLELKKHWVGGAGDVTLNIGSAAGGSQIASTALSGTDGTTGSNAVDTGTYYVAEVLATPADYTSTLACTDNGSEATVGQNGAIPVAAGHTVVCTYTNTRKGSIELKKHWVGTVGTATLNVGSTSGGHEVTQTSVSSDGSTGAKTVGAGTYYVSESVTNASDYSSSLSCTDNGASTTIGQNGSLAVADAHTVVCTFTNTRNRGTIELEKHWAGTAGDVTLAIGTAAGGAQVASKQLSGADGTTGTQAVDTGTYYVSEAVTNGGDYTTALACTNGNAPVAVGQDGSVSVGAGGVVVCTYTNTRKQGSLELKKHWVGGAGDVSLKIGSAAGGSQVTSKQLSGADGTTGAQTVDTGTYYVSESLANAGVYSSTLVCMKGGNAVSVGQDGAVAVGSGDAVVCTFTNTHNGSLELRKHWVGTAGDVTLAVGTATGGSQVASKQLSGADGTTGAKPLDPATYYISEAVTNAADYTSTVTCTNGNGSVAVGQDGSVAVGAGDVVVCMYTNTRKQGSLELKKHWAGTAGDVTLAIGSAAGGSQVTSKQLSGSDGTTGAKTLDTGTYYVSETVANAADYTTAILCTNGNAPVSVGQDGSVAVGAGDAVVCTYTNTRKQGSLELRKHWVGGADAVTLKIGSAAGGSQVTSKQLNGADGTTGASSVETGTYYVSESLANAGEYTTTLDCADAKGPVAVAQGGAVAVGDVQQVVCTFTNTHKGSLELRKHWVGSAGDVTLAIGTAAGGAQVASKQLTGADGTTGTKTLDAGTYYVAETLASPGDYESAVTCTDNGAAASIGNDGSVAVADAHTVVCTYANTRKQGTIELAKHWVGGAGNVTLAIGTTAGGSQVASKPLSADGTTGAQTVDTGTYYVSETLTNASDYTRSLDCTDNGTAVSAGTDGALAVGTGHHVVCTFTNAKLPTITVRKIVNPSGDDGTFDFAVDGKSFDNSGGGYGNGGSTGAVTVATGTHSISETGHGSTALAGYGSSYSCSNGQSGNGTAIPLDALAAGQDVTCTFTNVRKGTIEIVKNTFGGDGTFAFSGLANFQLTSSSGSASQSFSVDPGTYHVTEAAKDGWILTGLSCTAASEGNPSGGNRNPSDPAQADITLAAGGFVRCTYANTKLATLIVKKLVDNSNGGGSKTPANFTMHAKFGAGFGNSGLEIPGSPAAGSSTGTTYSGLLPGFYVVSEDPVDGYSLTSNTCSAPVNLTAGATVTCTLTNTSAAPPVTPPPTPVPPAPTIDLSITKIGTPNPASLAGNVTWTMVVTNKGPSAATGVTVADPAPAGTSFVSVATTQGTCTGGAVVSCAIGSMPAGSNVTVTLVTRAETTGTLTNTATVVGNEHETDTTNNSASTTVRVNGPFRPPLVYCTAVGVAPKQLTVGQATTFTLRIVQHGKHVGGVRVRISGKPLGSKSHSVVTKPSAKNGLVKMKIFAARPGILTFTPAAAKTCGNRRVGVIGVFTPPVTG